MIEYYRTKKSRLKNVLRDEEFDETLETLNQVVLNCNKLVIQVYQFLRLYVLYKYHLKETNKDISYKSCNEIPELSFDLIRVCFIILSKKSGTKVATDTSLNHLNELTDFYNEIYSKTGYIEKIDKTGLSQLVTGLTKEVLTGINNNIKLHFVKYLKKFVKCFFNEKHEKILKLCKTQQEKTELNKLLKKDLYVLTQDLLDNEEESTNVDYRDWYREYKNKLLPILPIPKKIKVKPNYYTDIDCHPQKYLKFMIYISLFLEQHKSKMNQFLPLRTNIIPKHVSFDTLSLIYILIKDKKERVIYKNKVDINKHEIWNKFFKMDKKEFRSNGYEFDYNISTNGHDISIRFLKNESVVGKKQRINAIQTASKKVREENKLLTTEQATANKINRAELKVDKKEEALQNLSLIRKNNTGAKKKIESEFKYIYDLGVDELKMMYDSGKTVYIDPGKNGLLTMMKMVVDIDEVTGLPRVNKRTKEVIKYPIYYTYSIRQRIHETKRDLYQDYLEEYKEEHEVFKREQELSKINLKTCDFKYFFDNVTKKNEINKVLFEAYEEEFFRKYQMNAYINNQRSDSFLVNKIKEIFGEDSILIFGDWSVGYQMKNFVPTPNIKIKRMLSHYFKIYDVDEYGTSCINYKTGGRNSNYEYINRIGKIKKLHQVLTYQMDNGRTGCINRDKCGVNGIRIIAECWMLNQTRPEMYKRQGFNKRAELSEEEVILRMKKQMKEIDIEFISNYENEVSRLKNNDDISKCYLNYLVKNYFWMKENLLMETEYKLVFSRLKTKFKSIKTKKPVVLKKTVRKNCTLVTSQTQPTGDNPQKLQASASS